MELDLDEESERLARELAELTGETVTRAVQLALVERLVQESLKRELPADERGEIDRIIRRVSQRDDGSV